ncbi:MAG: hypothetical protein JXB07_05720 [Anaerolineae bacterium]|nr:hypothetical protein [Anaerolineae bacterium]
MRYRNYILIVLLSITLACNLPSVKPTVTPTSASTTPTSPTSHPATETATDLPAETPTATLPPTATAASATSEAVTSEPPPNHGALLYETRFRQGWVALPGDKAVGTPKSDGYQIDISQPWALYAYTTHTQQSSFFAEITASPVQCPEQSGAYGMIFHYQSNTSFRFFVVWCSGRYSLLERTGPLSVTMLAEGTLPEEIDPATGEHTLSVHALNKKLTLYVDNKRLAGATVTGWPTGDFGPYAETIGEPLSVLFTWLSIYSAQ